MPDNTKINTLRLRACDGEDIWRTINGAKVLIDEGSGEIKGGAGGKLNGKKFKPSFGKSLKSGKKVLLPSIHTKMKHFKGSKAQLLQNLKKAVEPKTQTFSRKNASIMKGVYSLNNAGVGTKITAQHVSPLGSDTTDWEVIDKGGRRYLKNLSTRRAYVLSIPNLKKYFGNASELSVTGLTNQKTNANMPQKSVLETKAIKKPNYTRSRLDHVQRFRLVNLAHDMNISGSTNMSEGDLRNEIRKNLIHITRTSYTGMPMDKFKAAAPGDVINSLWRRNRKPKNPLLHRTALQQVVTSMDLDKPPTVLPAKDFDKYVKDNKLPVMYRSVGNSSGPNRYGLTGKDLTNGFRYDKNAWIGEGIYGDGHYFAEDWHESRHYGDNTIKAAIDPKKVKVFDYHKDSDKVPSNVFNDDAQLAVWCLQHGYNVIYVEGGNYNQKGHDFWNVLDRSCLIVSEEDVNEYSSNR